MEASLPAFDGIAAVVVMGVAGCGKSTIAQGLAAALGGTFIDGDDLHPPANIAKMSRGEPLTDEDRWPWLTRVGRALAREDGLTVIACSALKRAYRTHIAEHAGRAVSFVYLDGSRELIAGRMSERTGHFMPDSLLDSQFEALEIPGEDEDAVAVSIDQGVEAIIADAVRALSSAKNRA